MKKTISAFALLCLSSGLASAQAIDIEGLFDEQFMSIDAFVDELESSTDETFEAPSDPISETNNSEGQAAASEFSTEDIDNALTQSQEIIPTVVESTGNIIETGVKPITQKLNYQVSGHEWLRFQTPAMPSDPKEANKILYRIPGAIERNGSTMLNIHTFKVKRHYIPCEVNTEKTLSQKFYRLKLMQGAPKMCREDISYQVVPYRSFAK